MIVVTPAGDTIDLGTVEATPTIGITDFSRRVTDDFGVTTVVPRGFSRRMSVRLVLPSDQVDGLQQTLADLRATAASWVADARFRSLTVFGFYKDFSIDIANGAIIYCTLTIEGLAETADAVVSDGDPAPEGQPSSLLLVQPVLIDDTTLVASNVDEDDAPAWSASATYVTGATVIRQHRVYESLVTGNVGVDPVTDASKWLDTGPTNRWRMFDQALGSVTTRPDPVSVTLHSDKITAIALLDVVAATVRVQVSSYDVTLPVVDGTVVFQDVPASGNDIVIAASGPGTVSIGTLLAGTLVTLGITEASPSASITDYSRKETDDFGNVTVVPRAWAKRMSTRALIRTDAIDDVASRIAAVRARPSLWIGQNGRNSLTVYGFFKEFSIEVGQTVSKLSLSIEGLSKATPISPIIGQPGRDGRDGIDGDDGLPGENGADGRTTYVHYAYANSADGMLNFAVGAPEGRTFVGTYTDFTSADSTNPAAYRWSRYAGPAGFGLASTGAIVIAQNSAEKIGTGAGAWDAQAFSTEGWRSGAQTSFRGTNPFGSIAAGLNSDPAINASFTSIDYGWFATGGGVGANDCRPILNGVGLDDRPGGAWDENTTFQVIYDNRQVRWLKDGWEVLAIDAPADLMFYFDSSIFEPGVGIKDIGFTSAGRAGVDGTDGIDGTDGLAGADGADGRTTYVHYAYANSADGTLNFAVGAPEGRTFVGTYTDFTPADSTNPAVYRWSRYAGPAAFGLASTGAIVIAQNRADKIGNGAGAWDAQAFSTEGWRSGAQVSFRGTNPFGSMAAGLNSDPASNASFTSLDYGWFVTGGGVGANACRPILGGVGLDDRPGGAWDANTTFQIIYDNRRVRWLKDGWEVFAVDAAADLMLYFDSSIFEPGVGIKDIGFTSAGRAGSDGRDGTNGTNGLDGKNGKSIHIAYADSPDGQTNFTTGAAAGRAYIGVYTDTNPGADSTDPAAYGWTLIRGNDGKNGLNGPGGYVHIAYADSADGTVNFHLSDPTGRRYIGTYTDQTEPDSTNPAVYAWQLVKGADGIDGFIADTETPVFLIESTANGTPKGSWTGGTGTIKLTKGGQVITAGVTYSISAQTDMASLSLSGNRYSFAGITADTGSFIITATYNGVAYSRPVNVKKVKDGASAFKGGQNFNGTSTWGNGVQIGSTRTPIPGGASVRVSSYINYAPPQSGNATADFTGTIYLYYQNETDGGPVTLLGSVTGSLAYRRNEGTAGEPIISQQSGTVSASFVFPAAAADKIYNFTVSLAASPTGNPYNVAASGAVQVEVQ